MSLLNPKFKESVYGGLDFKEVPYETNGRFSIYIPKPKDCISDALEKFKTTQEKKYSSFSSPNKTANGSKNATMYEKFSSPNQNVSGMQNTQKEPQQQQTPNNINSNIRNGTPDSKLKSKLLRDVEQARAYESANSASKVEGDLETQNYHNNSQGNLMNYGSNLGSSSPYDQKPKSHTTTVTRKKFDGRSSRSVFSKTSGLKESLYMDPRTLSIPKSSIKNKVIENIIDNEQVIVKNPLLVDSIFKLRDLNLLKKNEFHEQKYKGVGKIDYVYNDYHSRSTNPGYSRNYLMGGAFFCR